MDVKTYVVVPKEGMQILHPYTYAVIPADGMLVERDSYWLRMEAEGAIEILMPASDPSQFKPVRNAGDRI